MVDQHTRVRTRALSTSSSPALASVMVGPADKLRLATVYRDSADLKPAARGLRHRGKHQVEQLAANIRRFGCLVPVLLGKGGTILNGHAIVAAAKQLGLVSIPTLSIDHLSDDEERVLRISLNRLQEMSTWDTIELKSEIEILSDLDLDLVSFTGFTTPELDKILQPVVIQGGVDPTDDLPQLEAAAVSREGDLWEFPGGHRLLCADARSEANYARLMAEHLARFAVCDLPYNVRIQGHVSGRSNAREFMMASGEMDRAEFTLFLQTIFTHVAAHSIDGALHLQFMDWRHIDEMMAAGRAVYSELKNLCIWAKESAGMGGALAFAARALLRVEEGQGGAYQQRRTWPTRPQPQQPVDLRQRQWRARRQGLGRSPVAQVSNSVEP